MAKTIRPEAPALVAVTAVCTWEVCQLLQQSSIQVTPGASNQVVFLAAALCLTALALRALLSFSRSLAPVLDCLSQSMHNPAIALSARQGKQVVGETVYWAGVGTCIALITVLVFFPEGPVEKLVGWLSTAAGDANLALSSEDFDQVMLSTKLFVTGYLLWWWLPNISNLSALVARLALRSLSKTESTTLCETLLQLVRDETKLNVRPAHAFFKNCILSLAWLAFCFAGWFALATLHPTSICLALGQMTSPFATPKRVITGYTEVDQLPIVSVPNDLAISGQGPAVHPNLSAGMIGIVGQIAGLNQNQNPGVVRISAENPYVVTDLIAGMPAAQAGLQIGDRFINVNGETLDGLSWQEAIGKIRGPVDSQVKLTMQRGETVFKMELKRASQPTTQHYSPTTTHYHYPQHSPVVMNPDIFAINGSTFIPQYDYINADIDVPSRCFFAALTALWAAPFLALMGCVWLPLRRQPKLVLSKEGIFFPLAQSGSLSFRPLRLWSDVASVQHNNNKLSMSFVTGGSFALSDDQIAAPDKEELLGQLHAFAPDACGEAGERFSLAGPNSSVKNELVCDHEPFILDNCQFADRHLSHLPLGRYLLLATPVAMILLIERCCLLLATNHAYARCRVSAIVRTILRRLMAPANASPKLLYVLSFVLPVILIFCPKAFLLPIIAISLIAIPFMVLEQNNGKMQLRPGQSQVAQRLEEWLTNLKPFLFWGLYISGVGGLLLMVADGIAFLHRRSRKQEHQLQSGAQPQSQLVLSQNKPADANLSDYNFYHSPAFPLTFLGVYLLGIPAAITWSLYWLAGLDKIWVPPLLGPTFPSPWLIGTLYLGGLGSVLSMIFFRGWFGLPLQHASTEFDIILNAEGVRQKNVKGWFADFLFYGWAEFCPREVRWSSVIAIDYEEKGFGHLTPIPQTMLKTDAPTHRLLNNMSALVDAYVESQRRPTYVVLRTRYDRAFGHGLKIRLPDLNQPQRRQLLDAINRWGGHAKIDERIEQALLNRQPVAT